MNDDFTASINHPSGRLVEVLLQKLTKGPNGNELPDPLRDRLNKLMATAGNFGRLARIRLAAEVSVLFERFPDWTKDKIVPLFDWSSPDAAGAWAARKYANYIGSPELFVLTKRPFLELFGRADVSDEEMRVYAEWLVTIRIANQANQANYPITSAEARSALRQAGVKSLNNVAHRLAVEMERAKSDEKTSKWRNVIGPIFEAVWPLDIELQTSSSTFKLVQILRASDNAFSEAAEIIIPFIRAEDPRQHSSIYSLSDADDVLYSSSPERMLELVAAIVADAPAQSIYGLRKTLDRIRQHAPELANTKKFQKLLGFADN